jgi:hypothetical protein
MNDPLVRYLFSAKNGRSRRRMDLVCNYFDDEKRLNQLRKCNGMVSPVANY